MDKQQNILQNLMNLPKFEPMTPKKTYYINRTTTYDTILKLIRLASKAKQFIIQTKYCHANKHPALITILLANEFQLHILLIETIYLTKADSILHNKIQQLFFIILSPSNVVHSWTDIKEELQSFLNSFLFTFHQIQNIRVTNIKDKFQHWFQNTFVNIELNNISLNDSTLEMAIAFMFQQYLDTTLSKSSDWNIGLFLELYPDHHEGLFHRGAYVCSLPKPNRYRALHIEYAIHECMAVNRIVRIFQNSWTRTHAENYLKNYYNIHH
ncbi:unnamed protein product [Rotaria sp. Silwood2]|nr:unnamed protein product [Rotaria sp. Silwood2]